MRAGALILRIIESAASIRLTLRNSLGEISKKSCNDDMILFIFHMNEDLMLADLQKRDGKPLYRALRCGYRTFFGVSSGFWRIFFAVVMSNFPDFPCRNVSSRPAAQPVNIY
ncbi:MAG: hypothetical protein P8013_10590 [Candidatus Sulfobium sp.]